MPAHELDLSALHLTPDESRVMGALFQHPRTGLEMTEVAAAAAIGLDEADTALSGLLGRRLVARADQLGRTTYVIG